MPFYIFENKITGEVREERMTFAEADAFEESNPDWHRPPASPLIVSGVRSVHSLTSGGFNDTLLEMKKKHPGSTIRTK